MAARTPSATTVAAVAAAAFALIAVVLAPAWAADDAAELFPLAVGAMVAGLCVYLAWTMDPAYTLSAAIFLTPLAGNWPQLGVPGPLSPDRILFIGGIAAVLLRAPAIRDRPALKVGPEHWLLGLALAYALISAVIVGSIDDRVSLLKFVDTYGVIPFGAFVAAPLAFRTAEARRVLLATLVALGTYLGLTVLFETVGLNPLVFPRYITDPDYGIHAGYGRGPFADAVANGMALFTCAAACGIAIALWKDRRWRIFAAAVGVLCLVGTIMTLERSVWIGAVVGVVAATLASRQIRRYFLPLGVVVAVMGVSAVALVPGLASRVDTRANEKGTVWDRQNLARASINMIEAKPLLGFGWDGFMTNSREYFEQSPDYPLTATHSTVHNIPLTYAVELGLIGLTLWMLALLVAVGSAITTRGPPDLLPWRIGLLAVAMAFVVVANAVPPTAWPNRSLWLLAGVALSGRYITQEARPARER
jgi:putative inorganic carbon (HCO3(-)) transporter